MNQDLKDHVLNVFQPIGPAGVRWLAGVRWFVWPCLTLVCCCLTACHNEDAIRIYNAPKEQTLATNRPAMPGGPVEPQEIQGALIAKENRPWAFKMVGSPEKVAQYKTEFRQLVDSFAVSDDGQPKWQLPESWREEPGNEFTFRTFRPQNESSVKATVSELAYGFNPTELDATKWQDYVAQNVNRWRGQLSLENQAWDEMSNVLEPIEKLSLRDIPAYYVTLRGKSSPMPGAMAPGIVQDDSATDKPGDKPPSMEQLQLTVPDGWREVAPLSTMAWRSFEADGPDGAKAQITFTPAGGDSVSNVIRWTGQIGGTEEQAKAAIDAVEKLEVNAKPTEVYKIVGSEPNARATTAAIVRWSDQFALFVKMTGPASAVSSQNEAFVSMLQSIKW